MELPEFSTRYNVMDITSIQSFIGIKGGINRGCKDVYFIRCLGCGHSYLEEIGNMDRQLADREGKGWGQYIRILEFPRLTEPDVIAFYSEAYENWERSNRMKIAIKSGKPGDSVETLLSEAVKNVLSEFKRSTGQSSASMEKNFVVKMMFWADCVAGRFLDNWNIRNSDKFACSGKIKKQEYLFCYLLTQMGVDCLLLLPEGEPDMGDNLKALSAPLVLGSFQPVSIPAFDAGIYRQKPLSARHEPCKTGDGEPGMEAAPQQGKPVDIRRTTPRKTHAGTPSVEVGGLSRDIPVPSREKGREMMFEELARLASSVVMITVHDCQGKITSTGSGIMIGRDGYILTNDHVASGGYYYSVRIEDDEQSYRTDEVIKYNQLFDLAVIRIDRKLTPIPVYKGERQLVRGQKVVAIGSPLGLFNSVSDGIISGFRKIHDVDMIQFTAPISHGSSGGAVLNMYGEVIGISTAGFDEGQNINLAVNFRCITDFIRGFV